MRLMIFCLVTLVAACAAPAAAAPASGGCVPNSSLVSAERATAFLENPEALLGQFKDGQGGLASEIRDMLIIRPETLEGIASLSRASSADQSRAIGAGLGTAASVCVLTQPAFAQQIQEVVLKAENPPLIQAFVSITGDIPTEAITGADPNGDTTAGGGRGTTSTTSPGAVSSNNSITFGGGGGASTNSTTLLTTAAAGTPSVLTPVSPTN
ncbi:hypothetical protein LJR220_004442 [Bradyrhizobium sp. LjRoot220]|uniref:hypothetical protein n=1 Tax=Bradyrhizobium sp. LjRoot220 TaxID=3342284 RepID=UPI003ECDBAAD